ncbi:potassium channel family protein [Croceimicrobium hydrocarbonivorans]|uniref:TrkA family potassium uptake protein n=1 Tax=Croceimicrobium hydrocarbonivorans TaxID=2761580 RepID=A0A7H0VAC3_9FLAO|nr:TrkA family potassium uptake protein [Croceimicrobium hydrocarbonivorans]QNR22671.1 TrkA family potassium uptake protein [Croceimicrobium hydrocarbonivorans]
MKYIIAGLGNFGASLSQKLTAQGHEVIGIDIRMDKVDMFKEQITHTIQMDATDEFTVAGLPLEDTDLVIVAVGEDQGANIMTSAVFKNLGVKRLISRAINPLHQKVLEAIGVDEIVHPEEETAERWAKKLCLNNVVDSFELGDTFSIIEAKVPEDHIGKTIREVEFRGKYNLLVLTIMSETEVKSMLGRNHTELKSQGIASPDQKLKESDVLVLYGANKDLQSFLKR